MVAARGRRLPVPVSVPVLQGSRLPCPRAVEALGSVAQQHLENALAAALLRVRDDARSLQDSVHCAQALLANVTRRSLPGHTREPAVEPAAGLALMGQCC